MCMGEAEETLHHLKASSAKLPIVYLPDINALVIQPIMLVDYYLCDSTATPKTFTYVLKGNFQANGRVIFSEIISFHTFFCEALKQPDRDRY